MPSQPATIRFNNPGAQYPGSIAHQYGSSGFGVIGGGHLIARFPDPVSGASAQFALLDRSYTGMTLAEAIMKWSGGNDSPAYIRAVANTIGIDPSTRLTGDMLRDPSTAIALASGMARVETGRPFPLSMDQWNQAHATVFGDGGAQDSLRSPFASMPDFFPEGSQSVGGNIGNYPNTGDLFQPFTPSSSLDSSLGVDLNSQIYSGNIPDYGSQPWNYEQTGLTGFGQQPDQGGFNVSQDPMGYNPATENRNTWQDVSNGFIGAFEPYPGMYTNPGFAQPDNGSQSVGGNIGGYQQNGDFNQPYQTQNDFNPSLGSDLNSGIYSGPAPAAYFNQEQWDAGTGGYDANGQWQTWDQPGSMSAGGTDIQQFGGNTSLGSDVQPYRDYESTPIGQSAFYDQNALENGTGGWNASGQWEYYGNNFNPSDRASATGGGMWNPSDYNSASGSNALPDYWDYSLPGYGTGTGYDSHDEPPSDIAPGLGTYGPGGFNRDYLPGGRYYDDGLSVFAGMTPGAQIGYSNFAQEDPRTGAMIIPSGGGINFADWGSHPLILK